MRIALLNLPIDNNYGGHLQRYALIKTLQRLGHTIVHINLKTKTQLPWYKIPYSFSKRLINKYILSNKNTHILYEKHVNRINEKKQQLSNQFYQKYIPHTQAITSIKGIKKECSNRYDVYIVGSDQVWRKSMTKQIGLKNYFFDFLKNQKVKRIAYAVSLGNDYCEYSPKDIKKLSSLYNAFDAVSTREISALSIFKDLEWNKPEPAITLDPTLLLTAEDYNILIEDSNSKPYSKGKIYSYILDLTNEKQNIIQQEAKEKGLDYIIEGLETSYNVSIEQWLCNIKNASMIVTDSYHGTVFSIIFKKPFIFIGNKRRGNTRIDSLFTILNISPNDTLNLNWNLVYQNINDLKSKSLSFLNF